MADDPEDFGIGTKLILSAGIVLLMIPGLVIEPGPLSEVGGFAALAALWGLPLLDGN